MTRIRTGGRLTDLLYLTLVLLCAWIFGTQIFSNTAPQTGALGRPRKVNMQKLQQRIQSGTLSSHKAMFWTNGQSSE